MQLREYWIFNLVKFFKLHCCCQVCLLHLIANVTSLTMLSPSTTTYKSLNVSKCVISDFFFSLTKTNLQHRGIDPIVTGSWPPQFLTLCYSLPIHFQGTCWKEKMFKNIYSFKIMCPQLWKFSFSAFSGQKISEGGVFWWWGQLF